MSLDEPGRVADVSERDERVTELLDGVEVLHPDRFAIGLWINHSAQPLPPSAGTKANEHSLPRKVSFLRAMSEPG